MIFIHSKMPEREHILSSGEKIRIRQLTPSQQLKCLALRTDTAFCKRLKWGLVSPVLTFREARKMLNNEPFRALEILRVIQRFSRERDVSEQNSRFQLQDEQFLNTLKSVELLKNKVPDKECSLRRGKRPFEVGL